MKPTSRKLAAYLGVMKVQIYKSIINQCIPVDVLKWAFDEGSDQSYWNDRALKVYNKLDCIMNQYGTQFLYVESDLVLCSILNRIDPLFNPPYQEWDRVTFNYDTKEHKWKLQFTDDFFKKSHTIMSDVDFDLLLVKNGDYFLRDYVYGHS